MSTDLDVVRLKIDSFNPKSANTHTSLSVAPNAREENLVVPDVGLVMLAESLVSVGE